MTWLKPCQYTFAAYPRYAPVFHGYIDMVRPAHDFDIKVDDDGERCRQPYIIILGGHKNERL